MQILKYVLTVGKNDIGTVNKIVIISRLIAHKILILSGNLNSHIE